MKKLTRPIQPPVAPVPPAPESNTLMDIHVRFMNLFAVFREKVCKKCGYSTPTYYRKAAGVEKKISNAEREKIKSVEKDCILVLMQKAGMSKSDLPGEAA